MNSKIACSLISICLMVTVLFSCGSDDDDKPNCNTFTTADSVCFCTANPDHASCNLSFTISAYTEEVAAFTPASNGTVWSKGFALGHTLYLIDRESASPHKFWKFDLDKNETWEELANFPGDGYGVTGSANGKGYASEYSGNGFWEYDPVQDKWTPLADLPFPSSTTHWVEYKGKFYVPDNDGIYEFNATTKEWKLLPCTTGIQFGAVFLIGDNMYWYNANSTEIYRYNLADKSSGQYAVPENFGGSSASNCPFVLGNRAYIVEYYYLWIFNPETNTWSLDEDAIESGGAYGDDVFVIDGNVYLIDNGWIKILEEVPD